MYPITQHDIDARKANLKAQLSKINKKLVDLCAAAIQANQKTSYSVSFDYAGHVLWADVRVYKNDKCDSAPIYSEMMIGKVHSVGDGIGFEYEYNLKVLAKELKRIETIIKYLKSLK